MLSYVVELRSQLPTLTLVTSSREHSLLSLHNQRHHLAPLLLLLPRTSLRFGLRQPRMLSNDAAQRRVEHYWHLPHQLICQGTATGVPSATVCARYVYRKTLVRRDAGRNRHRVHLPDAIRDMNDISRPLARWAGYFYSLDAVLSKDADTIEHS